jgi:serine/threonine protein kinase
MSMRLGSSGDDSARDQVDEAASLGEAPKVGASTTSRKVKNAGLHVVTDMEIFEEATLNFRHKLIISDYSRTPGVKRLVENILAKPTLMDHCVERGMRAEDIHHLAVEKYGGDHEMAAASLIKENIDRWTRIETSLGSSVGLEAIQADQLARKALSEESTTVIRHEASGISFVNTEGQVFVIDATALGEGSFKTAVKVVEYFTGRPAVFLQATESPIAQLKAASSSEEKKTTVERIREKLLAAGDSVNYEIKGAPLFFMSDILHVVTSSDNTVESGTESEFPLAPFVQADPVATGDAEVDSDTFIMHPAPKEVETGTFVERPAGERLGGVADTGSVGAAGTVDLGTFIIHQSKKVDTRTFVEKVSAVERSGMGADTRSVGAAGTVDLGTVIIHQSEKVDTGTFVEKDSAVDRLGTGADTGSVGAAGTVGGEAGALPAPEVPDFMKYFAAGGAFKTMGAGQVIDSELSDWKHEIELYRELAAVPHTAKLHAVIEVASNPYSGMMMEPCEGELEDFILESKTKLALGEMNWNQYKSQACSVLADAAEHYAGAHALGIVNRDIKEGNIMTREGSGVVSDFGTAARITERGRLAQYAGTPIYSAPESVVGNTRVASDVWSFAIVMHNTLVGPMETNPIIAQLMKDCKDPSDPHAILRALRKLTHTHNKLLRASYEDISQKGFDTGDVRLNLFFARAFSLMPELRPTMEEAHTLLRTLAEEARTV